MIAVASMLVDSVHLKVGEVGVHLKVGEVGVHLKVGEVALWQSQVCWYEQWMHGIDASVDGSAGSGNVVVSSMLVSSGTWQ